MLPAALQLPAFRRLFIGSTLSQLGSMLMFIVMPLVLLDATGSTFAFAAALSASGVAVIVAMPLGGVLADRFDRRRMLLFGDAAGMTSTALMLGIIHTETWLAIPFLAFGSNLLSALNYSAGPALRREALTDEHRVQGNALMHLGGETTALAGPLVGVALYSTSGFTVVALIDIATFIASFTLVYGIRGIPTRPARSERSMPGIGAALATAVIDIRIAIRAVRRDAWLRVSIASQLLAGIAFGLLYVASIPWFDRSLDAPDSSWGIMITIMGAAGAAASFALARFAGQTSTPSMLRAGGCFGILASICFWATPPLAVVWAGCVLYGISVPTVGVAMATVDQQRIPAGLQGRIGSIGITITNAGFAAGSIAGAGLTEGVGPAAAITGFAAMTLLAGVLHVGLARRAQRPIVLTDADVDALVDELAAV